MYSVLSIFASSIEIERKRLLPAPARVLVRRGQQVLPEEIVAESLIYTDHLLLDAARALGISADRAASQVYCKPGQQVSAGDLLAGPVGLARRVLRAPHDGKVVLARDGKILLERKGQPKQIMAGLPGEVVDLITDAGAVIRTTGGLVQGVWGNGRLGSGEIALSAEHTDAELPAAVLGEARPNSILVVGALANPDFFSEASASSLQGLIVGSLAPGLVEAARQAPWPVMVVDGFGSSPMNPAAWQVLVGFAGQQAALNGQLWERRSGIRPEVVLPALASEPAAPPRRVELFMPGQQVRLLGCHSPGKIGILVDLTGMSQFESGCLGDAARVRLEGGEEILAPLANLERLG